jgi:hypothetical protein
VTSTWSLSPKHRKTTTRERRGDNDPPKKFNLSEALNRSCVLDSRDGCAVI